MSKVVSHWERLEKYRKDNQTWYKAKCLYCGAIEERMSTTLRRKHRCTLHISQLAVGSTHNGWIVLQHLPYFSTRGYLLKCSQCGDTRHLAYSAFHHGQSCLCTRAGKREATLKERYGVTNPYQISKIRERIDYEKAASTTRKTVRARYGVDNVNQLPGKRKALSELKTKHRIGEATLKEWAENNGVSYSASRTMYTKYGEEFLKHWAEKLKADGQSLVETTFLDLVPYARRYGVVLPGTKIRPDVHLGDNTYVECDGLYFHSEIKYPDKRHHLTRRLTAEEQGYRLLFFRSDEIFFKPQIVKSICDNAMNKCANKIGARKCTIQKCSSKTARSFLSTRHIMGEDNASSYLGLYHEKVLVAVISYRVKPDYVDISRFCSELGYSIPGGFGKLISHIRTLHPTLPIHSWVDMRYGTGKSYRRLGFKRRATVNPSFRWSDGVLSYPRQYCVATDGKSQSQVAEERKLFRVWDAGQALFILPAGKH